jgi:hypothetical protein
MATSEILKTYNAAELKRMIRAANITGYSKLKKDELIKLMLRKEHQPRFKSIKSKSERTASMPQQKKVLGELKKKQKASKKQDEFYKKSGFTPPKDLPPPAKKVIEPTRAKGKKPPPPPSKAKVVEKKVLKTKAKLSNLERSSSQTKQDRLDEAEGKKKVIKKQTQSVASRLDEAEGKKKGEAKPPTVDGVKVAKTIRQQFPEYVKKVVDATKKDLLPNGGTPQKRKFMFLYDIFTGLKSEDSIDELDGLGTALELIEDDDDSLEAYNILFGKLNKNKLEKRYIDLIFFLLASGDRSKIQLGRSALNNAEEELQKKMVKKNRVLYLKFVSTMADKTGIKQKEADKDNVDNEKKKKQFAKDLKAKEKEKDKEELENKKRLEEAKTSYA